MSQVFGFIEQHVTGVWTLLAAVLVLGFFVNWMAWVFGQGRYAGTATGGGPAESGFGVVSSFFAKLISEFRHLLALLIFALFAIALVIAMLPGVVAQDVDQIRSGVQVVAASLGGLIGGIIGYYFGESAAARAEPEDMPDAPPVQMPGPIFEAAGGIQPAAKPAVLTDPAPVASGGAAPDSDPGAG